MDKFELVKAGDTVALDKISDAGKLTAYSQQLSKREILQITKGFESQSYEMVSLFVWTRAITSLKNELAKLGMQFVGEMLGRPDIGENTSSEVITDSEAVSLAESLGVVTTTEAMRLRQAQTVVAHFSKPPDTENFTEESAGMSFEEAISCLRACIKNILGRPTIQLAQGFINFRDKIRSKTFKPDDPDIEALINAPYFFKKTTLNFLLSASKSEQGAQLTHVLNNFQTILPILWKEMRGNDKWQVGNAYAEAYSSGREVQVSGMKRALIQVRGFDFVPETTRSNTFSKAAQKVLAAHEGINNYHTEVPAITELKSLGTVIPMPAFPVCMRAALCVYLGNMWGNSWAGALVALELLKDITPDRWKYFLDECLPTDKTLLYKLTSRKPVTRWCTLTKELKLHTMVPINKHVLWLVQQSAVDKYDEVEQVAANLANTPMR